MSIYDLAIMIMEIVGIDMEIVVSDMYAYSHKPIGKLRPKLYITENDKDISFLDLIEDIYGFSIERDELGLAVFSIAHEIGHHMEVSNKSMLARFICDMKYQGVKREYHKSCEETEELYEQYHKEYEAYIREANAISDYMKECLDTHNISGMREVLERQRANANKSSELRDKLQSIMDMREQHRIEYRLMPGEVFADKWAIEFIKREFPELIVGRIK